MSLCTIKHGITRSIHLVGFADIHIRHESGPVVVDAPPDPQKHLTEDHAMPDEDHKRRPDHTERVVTKTNMHAAGTINTIKFMMIPQQPRVS
jgi:hypothetical protein